MQNSCYELFLHIAKARAPELLGLSFTNDDGEGSKNVIIKTNSRLVKRRRDYSNSL